MAKYSGQPSHNRMALGEVAEGSLRALALKGPDGLFGEVYWNPSSRNNPEDVDMEQAIRALLARMIETAGVQAEIHEITPIEAAQMLADTASTESTIS